MPQVVHEIGVGGELTAKPGGVGQGAERAAEQIHTGPPVQTIAPGEQRPAITHFRVPLGAPLVARRSRHDGRAHADHREARAKEGGIAPGADVTRGSASHGSDARRFEPSRQATA